MFYLGTHQPQWLGLITVPLFVSRRRLVGYRRLPRARAPWSLDSGGFSELTLFGTWTTPPRQYVAEVRRFIAEIGLMGWAAIQDWMCEPHMLKRTGLSVRKHQARTVRSLLELRNIAPEIPWMPVLQGWHKEDYLDHLDQYARAGYDLTREPIVGLGSVCRRQATDQVVSIARALFLQGIRIHGFGVKTLGLRRLAGLITSSDSMAWSQAARREATPLPECVGRGHKNCANCATYALRWRDRVLHNLPDEWQWRPDA